MPNAIKLNRRSLLALMSSAAIVPLIQPLDAFAQTAEPKRGGTMSVMFFSEPTTLVSFTNTNSLQISAKTTEGLLWYTNDMEAKPQLATEWSVSEDGLTYTFKLREGVKWHDGEPFTSQDVLYSLTTLKQIHPRARSTFAHVTSIEAPDTHTIVLKLDVPVPYLIKAFAAAETPIVPNHIYKGTDPATNENNVKPIGTGPFKLKVWERGSYIEFERNPDYWDQPRPYLDRLIVRFIPDAAARSIALETGSVDLGYRTPVALNDVERLRANANLGFEARGYNYSNNVISLNFNIQKPMFQDVRVRQAIAHAINRDVMCRTVFYNLVTPCASPIAPFLKDYHIDSNPLGYDVKKAEALLEQAGLPRKDNGKRFSFIFDANPTLIESRRLGDFLKASLSRIGIDVEVRTTDTSTFIKQIYTDRNFEVTSSTFSNLFDPTVGVQRLYWSKNFKPGVPYSNTSGYSNQKCDDLLEAAAVELDPAKRKALFAEFQTLIMTDVPDINIGVPVWLTIHTKRALGHSITADGIEGNLAYAYVTDA